MSKTHSILILSLLLLPGFSARDNEQWKHRRTVATPSFSRKSKNSRIKFGTCNRDLRRFPRLIRPKRSSRLPVRRYQTARKHRRIPMRMTETHTPLPTSQFKG